MLHRVMLAACVAALALAPSAQAFTSPAMLGLRPAPAAAARRVGPLRVGRSLLRAPRVAAGLRMQETEAPPAEVVEKFEFQAEVSRVMDIIINSLYSDKVSLPPELYATTTVQVTLTRAAPSPGALWSLWAAAPRACARQRIALPHSG